MKKALFDTLFKKTAYRQREYLNIVFRFLTQILSSCKNMKTLTAIKFGEKRGLLVWLKFSKIFFLEHNMAIITLLCKLWPPWPILWIWFCLFSLNQITENLEAVVQRFSVKKVFLDIPQNSQENTCARVSFLIDSPGTGVFLWILRNI